MDESELLKVTKEKTRMVFLVSVDNGDVLLLN